MWTITLCDLFGKKTRFKSDPSVLPRPLESFPLWRILISFAKNILLKLFCLFLFCCSVAFAQESEDKSGEYYFIEGEKYFILGEYKKAHNFFNQAAAANPYSGGIQYKLAEAIWKEKNNAKDAIPNIEKAISLDKKNESYYQFAAQLYAAAGETDKAAETLEKLYKETHDKNYLFELAAYYMADRKANKAIDTYDKAEEAMGVNEFSSLEKMRLYFENEKPEKAIAEGEKLCREFPDNEEYITAVSESLVRNNQAAKAAQWLETFVMKNSIAGDARLMLIGIYHQLGQSQKEELAANALVSDASIHLAIKRRLLKSYAETYSKKEINPPSFVSILCQKLLKQFPADAQIQQSAGDLQVLLTHSDNALSSYIEAIHRGVTTYDIWEKILELQLKMGLADSALYYSEKALELYPNVASLHFLTGQAWLMKKNPVAIRSFEHALRLNSGDTYFSCLVNGQLGDAYQIANDFAKAEKSYEKALNCSPAHYQAMNNYCHFLALRKSNLDKAAKLAAQCVKDNPGQSSFLYTYAMVLFAQDKFEESRKQIEQAIQQDSTSANYFERYGDILFKLNRVDDAVINWQKSKILGNRSPGLEKKIIHRKLF